MFTGIFALGKLLSNTFKTQNFRPFRPCLLDAALNQPISVREELKPILSELRAWGKNLNQLTTLAHQGRVQTAYLQELTAALGRTYEAVSTLAEKGPVIYHGNL